MKLVHMSAMAAALCAAAIVTASAQSDIRTISTGKSVEISKNLGFEVPTVFVFYKPASTLEADFVAQLQKGAPPKAAVRLIQLTTGQEPIAGQYEILKTPTAIVMDRRGRITGRSSDAAEIGGYLQAAVRVMRIDWAEEGTALYDAADLAAGGKGLRPGIMRTMSLQPAWLKDFFSMTRKAHFTDSALTRKTKEMIATYVSGLNKCKF